MPQAPKLNRTVQELREVYSKLSATEKTMFLTLYASVKRQNITVQTTTAIVLEMIEELREITEPLPIDHPY